MANLTRDEIFGGRKMTRALVWLAAFAALMGGTAASRAQGVDMRELMGGGGPSFYRYGNQGGGYQQGGYGGGRYYQGGGDYYGGGGPIPRQTVSYPANYAPGTIIVNTAERRLYLVQGNGTALQYGIGVGRDGFRWSGVHRVSAKREWPGWTPPREMRRRRPDLPGYMPGGMENPLGARAIYLGSTLYRIHGSNEPETIGQAVSSGCFRMTNEDVSDLYDRVRVGATVIVKN
jgi:lipoprotein-anchoring transpeptidase ErfK/SrfK